MGTILLMFQKVNAKVQNDSKALQILIFNSYLLLKLGDFITNPGKPMKKNLENIINYMYSCNTTDLTAIFIATNVWEKSVQDFVRDILESQLTQDKAARLVDIICDQRSSQGILIAGNKRLYLRPHGSILHSMSEVTQIGESQSFFLPESFTGTGQQSLRLSGILEEKLLKLVPIDINRLENIQQTQAQQPSISSSLISRLSISKRAKQESLIINNESFTESLRKVNQDAPMGAGLAQQLFQEADGQFHKPENDSKEESQSQNKLEKGQGEPALTIDDQDSAYIRQLKRLLTHDFESGNEGGKLVGTQGFRDNFQIFNATLSILYQKKPSGVITALGYQKLPKIIILGSENKRLNQIQKIIETLFIKEATDPPFKFGKSQASKEQREKSQKEDQESFRTIFDINQVILLIDRNFFNHLVHGDLDISEVDYLIFDEVQNIYAESYYVNIMNKFIFNHKLMLSPQNKPDQFQQKQRLPQVLAIFSLESVLQAANNNDEQIFKKFQFMANTFNASLLSLQKQDLENVEMDIVREFSQIRVSRIQDIIQLSHHVKNYLKFLQNARKYLSFRRDGQPRFTCLANIIIQKKKLQPYLFLQTKFAKITVDEAIFIIKDFWARQIEYLKHKQIETKNIFQEPTFESAQFVQNSVRYFSSRIKFDNLLFELLGEDKVKELATKVVIPSQQENYGNQLFWVYSNHLFLKKKQSESQAALEMCNILYQLGYLDSYLRPSIFKLAQAINPSECSQDGKNRDENVSISISDKQQQEKEENKSDGINSQQMTKPFTGYESLNNATLSNDWEINQSVFNSKTYCQGIKLWYEVKEEIVGKTYCIGYINKTELRRMKFSKEKKKTMLTFYYRMRCYLEDAYKEFETKFLSTRKKDDKRKATNDDWLNFNQNYSKSWKINHHLPDEKRQSAIQNAAKKLSVFISIEDQNYQDIPEIRKQIINYLTKGLQKTKVDPSQYLVQLESERVWSQKIRDLLQSCDIKIIDCLSSGMNDVGDFVKTLNDTQVQQIHNHLIEYGIALRQQDQQIRLNKSASIRKNLSDFHE